MEIITDPQQIEQKSFNIIKENIGELDCSPAEEKIIYRTIHATADFDFKDLVVISDKAVEKGQTSLQSGANIVTDVNMLKAGISKRKADELGIKINCYISQESIAEQAKELEITRSMMCMRHAVKEPNNEIFVIGNAPTALVELIRLIRQGKAEPKLIIGTPVGFVGAKEAKAELEKLDIPHITVRGRKGGTAVAASIINALLYL